MFSQKLLTNFSSYLLAWALRQESRLQAQLRRLVLAAALEPAYARFARRHPRWAESMFDRHFLASAAAPLLARYWQDCQSPVPAELALAWLHQLGVREPGRRLYLLGQVMPVAADFLACLEEELQQYQGGPARPAPLPAA